MQARQLRLPPPPPPSRSPTRPAASPAAPSSLLLDPPSGALAVMLPDSSLLLYPSPLSAAPSPPPTAVPPGSTASCFLRLSPSPRSRAHVLFLSAAPRGPDVVLRAWALREEGFVRERLVLGKRAPGMEVALDFRHGFKVRICGSVNVFVLYSAAAGKLLVFGARVAAEGVEVMKCAVVDCIVPVYTIAISWGLLMLGEVGGVRVFPLRPLMKGKAEEKCEVPQRGSRGRSHGGSSSRGIAKGEIARDVPKKRLPNGVVPLRIGTLGAPVGAQDAKAVLHGLKEEAEPAPAKQRTMKVKQNSGDHGSFLMEFKHSEAERIETKSGSVSSLKAVAIHALAQRKFLILDSGGDLHVLSMQSAVTSEVISMGATLKRVDCSLKAQMLAVLPDISSESQIAWISDGFHSIHMASLTVIDESIDKNKDEGKEMPAQISVTDAIFTGEKIQSIASFASNAVLILVQGNIYAYATD